MTDQRLFVPPPAELRERWITDSKTKPTLDAAHSYLIYKAAEWGFRTAMEPDPTSLKSKALKALDKIQGLEVVSVWLGKESFNVIRQALEKLPNY